MPSLSANFFSCGDQVRDIVQDHWDCLSESHEIFPQEYIKNFDPEDVVYETMAINVDAIYQEPLKFINAHSEALAFSSYCKLFARVKKTKNIEDIFDGAQQMWQKARERYFPKCFLDGFSEHMYRDYKLLCGPAAFKTENTVEKTGQRTLICFAGKIEQNIEDQWIVKKPKEVAIKFFGNAMAFGLIDEKSLERSDDFRLGLTASKVTDFAKHLESKGVKPLFPSSVI